MTERTKTYEDYVNKFVTKKQISIGIIILIIIILTAFFNFSTLNISSLSFPMNNRLNESIQMKNTQILSTVIVKFTSNKSIANVSSKTITQNSTRIFCDNHTSINLSTLSSNPCERIRCVVILRRSGGRLGNRMFMFASAYGLARTHHCYLYVSGAIRAELAAHFQMQPIDPTIWLPENELNRLKNIEIKDTICSFFPDLMTINAFQSIELHGYWQSYLYFDAYREEIRKMFTARTDTLNRLTKYFTGIVQQFCSSCSPLPNGTHDDLRQALQTRFNITWISIHIRRTDIISHGCASNEQYIYSAMDFYRRRYSQENVRFLVASDDRPYCRRILAHEEKSQHVWILPNDFAPIDDLMALSFCHHSIVTVGTFGFWTGYLTGGAVVHDIKCRDDCLRTDYYPPWFLLIGTPQKQKKI